MKLVKRIIYFLPILILFSCNKELELSPTDLITEQNAFTNLTDIQQAINAASGRMGTYVNDMYSSAIMSDEAKLGPDNAGGGALVYRYQFTSDNTGSEVTALWSGYYAVIDQVNRVFNNIDKVKISDGAKSRVKELKGQLYGMRAFAYSGLLKAYSKKYDPNDQLGVPLVFKTDITQQIPRSSVSDVCKQIESDFATADTLLSTSTSFSDTVINYVNLQAFKARYYLYKGDYQKAIDAATFVINSGAATLESDPTNFASIWSDDSKSELLFRVRYTLSNAVSTNFTNTSGDILFAPSDKLLALFTTDDMRQTAYFDVNSSGSTYLKKFYNSSKGGGIVDAKLCRVSEMFLIRAEAYAKLATPNLTAATADLNALRSARINNYTNVTFSSVANFMLALMDERYKELCFEGFRIFDLKRNGLPVLRGPSDASAQWQSLQPDNFRFVFPIPNDEILANKKVVQNPGY